MPAPLLFTYIFTGTTKNRRLNHDKAVLSGAHDEAAVKQFLIEQAVVDSSELTNLGKSHTCVIERYSAYFPGQCVPTQVIMDYLSGKLVPEPNLDATKDPVPYIPPTYGDVEAHRYEAVQALAAWLRLLPLDKLTSRVQYLLFPAELWDDAKLQKLQLYKAHVGKMGVNARDKLVEAQKALDTGDLEHGQLPRATRLKLTAHIRAARMIGYEIEGVDMEESDDSFAELLSEEIGFDDVSKGKMLEDRIREQLRQLGQNVTEEDKLRIIQEAEEEAAIAPEIEGVWWSKEENYLKACKLGVAPDVVSGIFAHSFCCFMAAKSLNFETLSRKRLLIQGKAFVESGGSKVLSVEDVSDIEGVWWSKEENYLKACKLGVAPDVVSGNDWEAFENTRESVFANEKFVANIVREVKESSSTPSSPSLLDDDIIVACMLTNDASVRDVLSASLVVSKLMTTMTQQEQKLDGLVNNALVLNDALSFAKENVEEFERQLKETGFRVDVVQTGDAPRFEIVESDDA